MYKARKRFGQNFLIDDTIIEHIIAAIAPKKDDNLLEIGPGTGAITLPLLEKVSQLHAIEIDTNLVALLKSFKKNNLDLHQGDILKFDLNTLPRPLRIVGNLPYNISSPILFHLLEYRMRIQDMTFMLQKEVVERITAKNGSKIYGRLSVIMRAFFSVELLFIVPPESFNPAPKVKSAIIHLKPLIKTPVSNKPLFTKLVAAAFSQRRKTLKNCLKSFLTQQQTEIDLSQRAEMLTLADFITLTQDLEARQPQNLL